jgi:hypothetical protein
MTRRGKEKKTTSDVKRGGRDHFTGFKRQFLESRALLYQQTLDSGDPGEFYNKVSRDFLAKFGQEDNFSREPSEDPPNPWEFPDDLDDPDDEDLSKEEADIRTARFNKLHKVSQ